jgi:hypothetical protein
MSEKERNDTIREWWPSTRTTNHDLLRLKQNLWFKNYFNTYIAEGLTTANKEVRFYPTDGTPISQIRAHKAQVDGAYKTFACLNMKTMKLLCEAYDELTATKDPKDKELAKPFNSKVNVHR